MKRIMTCIATAALIIESACTPVVKELRYPGGYPGYLLDKRTFNTSGSKQLLLLRATLILAMAAEMSRVTVKGEDADAFAKHLAAAAREINLAAADLYPTSDANSKVCATAVDDDANCTGFYANFEGDIPLIEGRIIKVMLAALPADRARKFLDDAAKGNILGAAWNAVGLVAKGVGGLHFAFGRYRSGQEIVAEYMGTQCVIKPAGGDKFDPETMTVVEAAGCLGLSRDSLLDNPQEAGSSALSGPVKRGAFLALFRDIASVCVDLPYSGDVATIASSRDLRGEACNSIGFKPTSRPFRISRDAKTLSAPAAGVEPAQPPAKITP